MYYFVKAGIELIICISISFMFMAEGINQHIAAQYYQYLGNCITNVDQSWLRVSIGILDWVLKSHKDAQNQ